MEVMESYITQIKNMSPEQSKELPCKLDNKLNLCKPNKILTQA